MHLKQILLGLFFFGLFFPAILLSQHNANYCLDPRIIASREASHHQHLLQEQQKQVNANENYDIKYLECYWDIDPAINAIRGTIKTSFTITEALTPGISFSLANELYVSSVLFNGQNVSFTHQTGEILTIEFPTPLALGDTGTVTVNYMGTPPNSGFGSFIQEDHNGTPIIWTLSEPYGSKDWWPSKLDLNDKADSIDIYITTPTAYRAASNGLLVEEISSSSEITYHWKHRYPITAYLIALSVTNYEAYSHFVTLQNGTSMEVLNYVYPEDLASSQQATAEVVHMIECYDTLVGLYPFHAEKYGHAQFNWSGGMEHQTMSFMGLFSTDLQSHELSHQWFGDKITCSSWEDIWLNEGFATYFTALYRLYKGDVNTWNSWKNGQIEYICSVPDGSVYCTDVSNVGRIFSGRLSYAKGSYLLHMLRWTLGDEDFYEAIRNYINDPALVYGYASTDDLMAHFENQSGIQLDEFMDDWFYGEGFPSYYINWYSNGNTLHIDMAQSSSHSSVDFFEMKVPIRVFGGTQDTIIVLNHEFSGQSFSVNLGFIADSIQLDPEKWILCFNNSISNQVSVLEEDALSDLNLFPNPAINKLIINSSTEIQTIKIYTLNGSLWEEKSLDGRKQDIIDLTNYPSGAYFLQAETYNTLVTRRFIKL